MPSLEMTLSWLAEPILSFYLANYFKVNRSLIKATNDPKPRPMVLSIEYAIMMMQ